MERPNNRLVSSAGHHKRYHAPQGPIRPLSSSGHPQTNSLSHSEGKQRPYSSSAYLQHSPQSTNKSRSPSCGYCPDDQSQREGEGEFVSHSHPSEKNHCQTSVDYSASHSKLRRENYSSASSQKPEDRSRKDIHAPSSTDHAETHSQYVSQKNHSPSSEHVGHNPHHRTTRRPASSSVYTGNSLHPRGYDQYPRGTSPLSRGPGASRSPSASSSATPRRGQGRPWTAPVRGQRLNKEHMERDEEDPEGRGQGSPGARRAAWQYSEEAKKKHEELIRKILEEFDLEATKQKYRNSYVLERRRDGKSVADFQFRAELERMMGSEVIRLNDKNWSRRFTERLLEDYYRYEEGQDHRRADEEKLRVHKLKVLGLIHEPEIYDRRLTVCRFKKRRKSKTPDEIQAMVQEKAERDHSLLLRRQTLEESQREKVYRTSVAPNIEDSIRSSLQEDSEESSDPFLSRSVMSFEERRQKSTQKRLSKNLPDDVKRIYDEESVAGLYNMAEKLVYFR